MSKRILSPRFKLTKANIPSTVKSAWISAGAVFVVAVLAQIPNIEFDNELVAILLTGLAGWVVNLVKEFVEEK